MGDEWRRYLAQQIELGGSEVILGTPPSLGERVSNSAQAATVADPKWKKGAPPIPGPGLVVESPEPGLLGNDLGNLTTLEEIAERIADIVRRGQIEHARAGLLRHVVGIDRALRIAPAAFSRDLPARVRQIGLLLRLHLLPARPLSHHICSGIQGETFP